MADKIKINTTTLNSDTTSIKTYLSKVKKQIADMQGDVTAMNKMWSGDANAAFNKAFNDDIKALQAICTSLEGIVTYETTAKTEYNSCESKVSALISNMSV